MATKLRHQTASAHSSSFPALSPQAAQWHCTRNSALTSEDVVTVRGPEPEMEHCHIRFACEAREAEDTEEAWPRGSGGAARSLGGFSAGESGASLPRAVSPAPREPQHLPSHTLTSPQKEDDDAAVSNTRGDCFVLL